MKILAKESSILEFSEKNLDSYKIFFNGKGISPSGDLIDRHELEMSLSAEYPRVVPVIRWVSPILHPNISGGRPCLGNFQMTPGVKLVEIVEILWDMARLAMFNLYGGYGEAASSFRALTKQIPLPVDQRILRDKSAPTKKEAADTGDEEIMFIGSSRLSGGDRRSYGAGIMIYDPAQDKILLMKRAGDGSYSGYWDFAGGHVEAGENVFEGAVREGEEELGGLPGLNIDFNPVWTQPGPNFAFASFLGYLEPSQNGWEPDINFEHDEWGWFSPDELPHPMLPGARDAIGLLMRKVHS